MHRSKTRTHTNNNASRKARVVELKSKENLRSARAARTCTGTATTAGATAFGTGTGAKHRLRLHRQQAFALQLLAGELARAAHGFGLFTDLLFGGLFIMAAELHLAENTLALHLLLQHLEGLVDIVVTDENLHAAFLFDRAVDGVVTGCGRRVVKTTLNFGLALQ